MFGIAKNESCPHCGHDDAVGYSELEWPPLLLAVLAFVLTIDGSIKWFTGRSPFLPLVAAFIVGIVPITYFRAYFASLQCSRCGYTWALSSYETKKRNRQSDPVISRKL